MRILYITTDYAAGPLASLTHHVTHALVRLAQREGHHVRVGSVVDTPDVHGNTAWVGGAAVTVLHKDTAHADPTAFAQWLQAQQADVVHCIAPTPDAADLPWPPTQGPTVVTLTGLPDGDGPAPAAAGLAVPAWLCHARHRVCATPAAQARWQVGLPGLAFRVLAHGVDLLALLRKFPQQAVPAPGAPDPTIASVEPLDVLSSVRWVPLHPASLLGLDGAVDAVVMPSLGDAGFSLIANECAALGLPCLQLPQLAPWLTQWASGTGAPTLRAMDSPMPTRIEEEAFFYDCLYRM